jgi:hypothetical protein
VTSRPVAVDVVLATYGGARFLPEQLASIAGQEGVHWRLIVRDDGSRDETRAIVGAFSLEHPGRVEWFDDDETGLGAARSFGRLLAASKAPYVFSCDQDDVWLPGKLASSVARLQAAEGDRGPNVPLLVHTDLRVVDEQLRAIAPSMNHYQHLGADTRTSLRALLVQNCVTGCTVGMNRALLELALPLPAAAIMHDWWLALTAAACGSVLYVPDATVAYRQHGTNAVGARRYDLRARPTLAEMRASLERTFEQADALHAQLGARLAPRDAKLVRQYADLASAGRLQRRWRVARCGFWKHGIARNVAMLLVL